MDDIEVGPRLSARRVKAISGAIRGGKPFSGVFSFANTLSYDEQGVRDFIQFLHQCPRKPVLRGISKAVFDRIGREVSGYVSSNRRPSTAVLGCSTCGQPRSDCICSVVVPSPGTAPTVGQEDMNDEGAFDDLDAE